MSTATPPDGFPQAPLRATIGYAAPTSSPAEKKIRYVAHTIDVHDARQIRSGLSLDGEGFVLAEHEIRSAHLEDPAELARVYAPEIAEVVREATGASYVVPQTTWWSILPRTSEPLPTEVIAQLSRDGQTHYTVEGVTPRPAGNAHADYTPHTAEELLELVRSDPRVAVPPFRRFGIYQTWHVLNDPPHDNTLALADSRSVHDEDLVTYDNILGIPDEPGNTVRSRAGKASERHRWYYFSHLRTNEIIVFVGYDPARPNNVLHTGFNIPDAGPAARPRLSLEARFFAFFE
ncbi:hypothetical protein CC117_24130 [Parafrankia colletiae]|uniref:Methyltransferase n=1 Tax=Parafrankia colletiae TaxID=573497 RepID=A0A1S1QI04_9ACTN|nr:CmcJ/NvfI family oxidoreductase [Parafrankia colletiae]MCK9901935.1 hypothetical protein [Frankia sp. Cpl3]OHV32885.1 hypothetical protein CC117_24130 [Parafrankia colletiae]